MTEQDPSKELKSVKQEAYCQARGLKGLNQSDSYRTAYNASNMSDKTINVKACELASNAKVKARIDELKEVKQKMYLEKHSIALSERLVSYLSDQYGNLEEISDIIEEKLSELLSLDRQKEFKRNRSINQITRYAVLKRAGFKCQCCGQKPMIDNDIILHVDHIIPFSLGGNNTEDNLQVLCSECNLSKGNRWEDNLNDNT